MKNNYSLRHLMTFLGFFYCFALMAQTMPTAQSLPYAQNFENLATSYPVGIQGWNATTPSSSNLPTPSSFTTTGVVKSDQGLTANGSATSTTAAIYNFNGKIGFLNGGNFLDQAIVLALDTSDNTGVLVQYDVSVIRNPYGVSSANRVNEMTLQYRVGETGDFTTVPGTLFSNNQTTRTSETVVAQTDHIKVKLPAECDNKPIVQIRWLTRQVSGGGARPSFAIDNIDVKSDNVPPVTDAGYPKTANVLSSGFDFINKINEAGKTYFVLLPGGSTEPTTAQIKAGQDAAGNAALQSGVLNITDPSQEYSKSLTALTLNTAYSVFSVSEDLYDNIQTAVSKVDVTTVSVNPPSITTTITSLDLGNSQANYEDAPNKSYQIGAGNLTNDVVLTAPANFTISKDNITFTSSLTFIPADFASNATPTVYVKFLPNAAGSFSGEITHESTNAVTKTVSLTGTGTNPYVQDFNDANVLTNSGWTQYNEAGPINKWTYTNVTRNVNSGTGAVLINGYSDTGASKDWLISPKLRLNNFGEFPLLSFYSRKFYAGPGLKLMVSTNYDGVSDPNTAVWTEIDGKFPTTTGTYVQSQYIKLDAYKTDHTYLAWVYETTKGGTNFASEWSFDDYAITDELGYVDSNPVLDFGVVNQNEVSDSQSFNFKAEGHGDIMITASASYQISADNISFTTSVLVSAADALAGKTLYAKFAPTTKELKISGNLTVTGTSLNKQIGSLTGSSLPKSDTFDVVTYNMEFFGAPTSDYGPANKALQMQNAVKVINKLDADVYVVQEISSDVAIDDLITQMNVNGKSFNKVVSTSWSYSWDSTSDPNYPPQKLVVIYDTKTTTLKNTRVMFKEFYDELRGGTKSLANYPGTNSNFFSSGRLPYMVTLETNVNGVKNEIKFVDLHARANSGTDISKYNMRKYDVEVLKDSLDTHYANSNIILLGDYNDDVKASVIAGQPSSYQSFVTDTNNYKALTLGISQAGAFSFLSSGGFLDHITISNELFDQYINESIAVYDPRNDIANYTTTTSDHGPVIARFNLKQDVLSTPDFGTKNGFYVQAYPNPTSDVINFAVKTNAGKNLKLRLYDLSGRAVGNAIDIQSSEEVNTTVMSLRNLNSGLYIYTVSENNKVVYKNKILKN